MKIVKGKACSGKTIKLIEIFCGLENAELISDELDPHGIYSKIKRENFELVGEYKRVRTAPDNDYYFWQYIYNTEHANILIDIHSHWFTKDIMYYIDRLSKIEKQVGQNFILTVQINANSDENDLIIEEV